MESLACFCLLLKGLGENAVHITDIITIIPFSLKKNDAVVLFEFFLILSLLERFRTLHLLFCCASRLKREYTH